MTRFMTNGFVRGLMGGGFAHAVPGPCMYFFGLKPAFRLVFLAALLLAVADSTAAEVTFTGLQPSPVESYRGSTVRLEYEFFNPTDRPIKITSVFPRKGTGSGKAQPESLAAGAKGKIILNLTLPESIGLDQVNFLVKTDSAELRTPVIRVPYFVQSAFEPELAVMDFGAMHQGQRLRSTLEISTRMVSRLKFNRVISKPDWLDVSFTEASGDKPQEVDIVATTTSTPPFGLNTGEIVVESNIAEARQLRIPVVLRSFNKYRASPYPLSLGAVPEGLDREATLRIERRGDGDVDIRKIETGNQSLTAQTMPCGAGCMDVMVSFDSMKARRGLRTMLTIHFSDDEVPLSVPIDALVVPIGVKIEELGDLDKITVKSTTTELEPLR